MKNQGNVTPPSEHSHFPVTNPNEMEICGVPDNEFKIVVLRMFSELQENTKKRQFSELKKTVHKQNETFNREIEIIKK